MPEEGKSKITFQSFHKKMKVPYVIYADFEAILHKMKGWKVEKGHADRGADPVEKRRC